VKVPVAREPTNSTSHNATLMATARTAATTWLRVNVEVNVPMAKRAAPVKQNPR